MSLKIRIDRSTCFIITVIIIMAVIILAFYLQLIFGLALHYDTFGWHYSSNGYRVLLGLSKAYIIHSFLFVICMGIIAFLNNRSDILIVFIISLILCILFLIASWLLVEQYVICELPNVEIETASIIIRHYITGEIHIWCTISFLSSIIILFHNLSKEHLHQKKPC
jgi:hypothetical protein